MQGFFAGQKVHIIDSFALTEPLLSRIPSRYDIRWRVGHFRREVPTGYKKAVQAGKVSFIKDKKLRDYYAHLKVITQGSLFTVDRWDHIWQMNMGNYDRLIAKDKYRFPQMKTVHIDNLSKEKKSGNKGDENGAVDISSQGLEVSLGKKHFDRTVSVRVGSDDGYRIIFMKKKEVLDEIDLPQLKGKVRGLRDVTVQVPLEAVESGYTALRFFPYDGDKRYSVGRVAFDRTIQKTVFKSIPKPVIPALSQLKAYRAKSVALSKLAEPIGNGWHRNPS
jgi:arabinofuranosyltransferase